jgi:site-specific DNA-methyltransferase (adenine-specific)
MEAMASMEDNEFDLAIVDPPYGYSKENTKVLNSRKTKTKNWNKAPKQEYFVELFRVSKHQIIWGGNYFPFIWNYGGKCFIYWHKGNPVENYADGELAWTSFHNKNASQFNYRYYGIHSGSGLKNENISHPTPKPVALYTWLLGKYAQQGWKILDTHLGSGSSAIAAHDMGYEFHGYELDEEYFQAASKRLKEHQKQLQLF